MRGTALAPDLNQLHGGETVTNIETIPKGNDLRGTTHAVDRDHLHGREAVTKLETIAKGNHVRGTPLTPDRDHLHCREKVRKIETLPKMNVIVHHHVPDRHALHGRETVTKEQTLPKMKGAIVYHHNPDHDHFLIHHIEIQFRQGCPSCLHQTVNISNYKTFNNLCNRMKTRQIKQCPCVGLIKKLRKL